MSQFHSLKINKIEKLTPSSVMLTFELQEHLQSNFAFTAGQYITFKKIINGSELRRSYSICSSPDSGVLSVGIKKIEGGTFSVFANDTLAVNDVLDVHEPEGRFTITTNPNVQRTVCAFAAGSGITPIMSIMKTLLEKEINSTFILVFGNTSVNETMFYDEILALKETYKNRLHVYFMFSQESHADALFGRIDASIVNLITKNKHRIDAISSYYLCGPEGMIDTVSKTLLVNGAPKEVIHTELFTSTISTDNTPVDTGLEGKTIVKGIVDDDVFEFTMDKSKRVLDAALENNVDAPYSCQGGICSSCIARLKSGKVEMVKNQILTDAEVAEGLILTCQAHPTSAIIEIDYDDV